MRAFYTNALGFTADLCLMVNGHSTRVTIRTPEGSTVYRKYFESWDEAVTALKSMAATDHPWVNNITGEEVA